MSHTLLLADDSLAIQRVVELTFAGEDIRVVAVGDGQQAIERLAAERPDIVLADIAMPLVDGYAVAEFIRATPAVADVPVLLLAGAFDHVEDSRLGASGARGVLVKPFEPHIVISRVKELLGLGGESRQSAVGGRPSEDGSRQAGDGSQPPPPAPVESTRLLTPPAPPRAPRTLTADAPFWREPLLGHPPAAPPSRPVHDRTPGPPPASAGATQASTPAAASDTSAASGSSVGAVTFATPLGLDDTALSTLVDRIAARVVEQLRDEITGIALDVSERLVREEIARIREAARADDAEATRDAPHT